jgi:hypothetical protein
MVTREVRFRVLEYFKVVHISIIVITQLSSTSTMHNTLFRKVFVGSHFWKREIYFLFVLKFGMLQPDILQWIGVAHELETT